MNVQLTIRGKIIVHNERDLLHVDAPCPDDDDMT
jgi:hypothetical protein